MYLESVPKNAIFQYREHELDQLTDLYAREGKYLGWTDYDSCDLPEAVGQVWNPETRIWTAKLKNGKFIDGLSSHQKFHDLPVMPN